MQGNRLLSVCTRLLIQELVCTDDGAPSTTLIKVAAARLGGERRGAGWGVGGRRKESAGEGLGEAVKTRGCGWNGESMGVIDTRPQTGANYGRSNLCGKKEGGWGWGDGMEKIPPEREKKNERRKNNKSQPATQHPSSGHTVFIIVLSYAVK